MDDLPLVSVIVRTIGRETLARTLVAIARQTYPRVETVVIDAAGRGRLDIRGGRGVRVVGDGRAHDRAAAANLGLDHAHGDWLIYLDDDDEFAPPHVEGLVAAVTRSPHLAAYSDAEAVDADGRVVKVFAREYSRIALHQECLFPLHAVLFGRGLIALGCRFEPSLALIEDWDFWMQVAEHTGFVHLPRRTARYFIMAGNSGAGLGANHDQALIDDAVRRVGARWQDRREQLAREHAERRERALGLHRAGAHADAEVLLWHVVEIDPWDVDAAMVLARYAFKAGRAGEAVGLLERAIKGAPERPDLHFNLALALVRNGAHDAARRHLESALKLDPGFGPARAALATLAGPGAGDQRSL
jgi:tetratricopeptide (TPR) repeat protein